MSKTADIGVEDGVVTIDGLVVDDVVLGDIVSRHAPEERPDLVGRMLSVGGRGLLAMGTTLDLGDVDARVRKSVEDALADGRRQVQETLDQVCQSLLGQLDPGRRASVVGRLLEDLERWQQRMGELVDPVRTDSHTGRLLAEVTTLLGPGGALEHRLRSALDPGADGSALATALRRLDDRLERLHEAVAEQRGRQAEAHRGTAKGVDYEDRVEEVLRRLARPWGATVERTAAIEGAVGIGLVGDFVVELAGGTRVVVECKNTGSIPLRGTGGILAELDRAMDNREAQAGVCVSATDAYPAEVGPFQVYGNRILVVDDGDGTMLWVALTWAAGQVQAGSGAAADLVLVRDRVDRIRSLAGQISTSRRALTDIVAAVEKVRSGLDHVRCDLIEAAADLGAQLNQAEGDGEVPMMAVS